MKITDLEEAFGRRDAYQRDYDSSISGFGRGRREIDDEANMMYIYKDGKVMQSMISNHQERQAHAQGFRDSPETALRLHGIVRSKYHHNKWIQNQAGKWVEVHPFGEQISETATAGATSSANIGTVVSPHLAIGRRNIGVKATQDRQANQAQKHPNCLKLYSLKTKTVQIGRRRVGKECLRLCRSRWSPYH